MPRLIPREQWVCDSCGEVILSAADGVLEFLTNDPASGRQLYDFRIIHSGHASPRDPNRGKRPTHPHEGCRVHTNSNTRHVRGVSDGWHDLGRIVGPDGLPLLLAMLDKGPMHNPTLAKLGVVDIRQWLELFRRLALPYYEEARLYWGAAEADGCFADGVNEHALYAEQTLRHVIDQYGPADDAGPTRV